MRMTFYTANCRGNAKNSLYPNKRVADNEDDFLEIIAFDHVCGEFKEFRRSGDNFLSCDVDVMDCDNAHSDNPAEWVHPEELEERLGRDVAFVAVPSRNNMKPKDGRSARPGSMCTFPTTRLAVERLALSLKKPYSRNSHSSIPMRWTAPGSSSAALRRRFSGMRARSPLTVSRNPRREASPRDSAILPCRTLRGGC